MNWFERYGIPIEFPDEALAEARAIDLPGSLSEPGRRDLTSVPTVTIDDVDTADRDDALSLEPLESGYRVGIHIADAGALVSPGGAMDQEADRRMATVYTPDVRIAMLPPEVADRAGSLVPGERRAALSLLARLAESGEILDWEALPSTIMSQAALTYDEADHALEDPASPWHSLLAPLKQLSKSLRQRRREAGAVFLDRPEMAIRVAASGNVEVRVLNRTSPARELIAEFMVFCNTLLADFCRREGLPAAYRTQAKLEDEETYEQTTGEKARVHALLFYRLVQRLPKADLGTAPAPHGGLGVPAYIQATSPLRRYPDLVMQRQISHFLRAGKPLYPPERIASVAQRAEMQLRDIARLEEDRNRYWFLKYLMQSRLAGGDRADTRALFPAVVLDTQPGRHSLLELLEYPFRVRAELSRGHEPGDTVTLRLHDVDLWRRVGLFVQEPTHR